MTDSIKSWLAIIASVIAISAWGYNWIWGQAVLATKVATTEVNLSTKASQADIVYLERTINEMKAAGWGNEIKALQITLATVSTDLKHVLARLGSNAPETRVSR